MDINILYKKHSDLKKKISILENKDKKHYTNIANTLNQVFQKCYKNKPLLISYYLYLINFDDSEKISLFLDTSGLSIKDFYILDKAKQIKINNY